MSIGKKFSRNPFPTKASPVFAAIPAPLLGCVVLVPVLAVYLLGSYVWPSMLAAEVAPLPDAAFWLLYYLLVAGLLWLECMKAGITTRLSLGAWPGRRQIWMYVFLAVPLIALSFFCVYVLFLPFSFDNPAIVTTWLLEESPLIWWRSGADALGASVINVVLTVVIAPMVEEVIFRGFLLNRWWWYHGAWRGAVFSSLVFALLHVDFLGALVFGLILSLVYIKTKSLVGPIIVHMANNGLVVALLLAEGVVTGSIEPPTLAEFQAHWWFAPLGAAIGIPWLIWFTRRLFRAGRL